MSFLTFLDSVRLHHGNGTDVPIDCYEEDEEDDEEEEKTDAEQEVASSSNDQNKVTSENPRQQVHEDYKPVATFVEDILKKSEYLKVVSPHNIEDYIGHLVAASFQNEANSQQMPAGYNFLPEGCQFPHPNAEVRMRTKLAGELCEAVKEAGGDGEWQIFADILFRFHNTAKAGKNLKVLLQSWDIIHGWEDILKGEPDAKLRNHLGPELEKLYAEGALPFSDCDSSYPETKHKNKDFVIQNLDKWYAAAVEANAVLQKVSTTPESWHTHFLKKMLKNLPGFGLYWSKFVYGDIGLHISKKCDLDQFSVIGPGCIALLKSWGLQLPKSESACQQPAMEILRELRGVVSAVFESHQHPGIEVARQFGQLQLPSLYDLQVASCECKRGHRARRPS